ncbi:MFS transporter [Nocardia grenadensis]|uniref:MFS transporter n=1 Tax=Nocardia grenadensis TaxID=931537 RepID=UPI003D70BC6A
MTEFAASASPADTALPQQPTEIKPRVVAAGFIGSLLEYFDFGAYGYLAVIIAGHFFVSEDPTSALLSTLLTFAAAFLLRPIGGVIFGYFGDKYGRKKVLAFTIFMMAVASGLIGVLPTYAAIGVGATTLLVLARCAQGLAASGEVSGAAAFVAEFSPNHRRGFLCSTIQTGALGGALLASLVITLLNTVLGEDAMRDWGWRIPFLAAIPLGLFGLWIRSQLQETPRFVAPKEHAVANPMKELFRSHRQALAICLGLSILLFSAYYVAYVYVALHLQTVVGMSSTTTFWFNSITLAVATVCMPFFGLLSDKVGRRPVFLGATLAALVIPIPAFMLFEQGGAITLVSMVVLGLIDSALMGVAFSAFTEMFPTRVRYTGIALGFNLGAALAGGFSPYICTWLVKQTGNSLSPAYFLMATALITLAAAVPMRETVGSALKDA